MTLDLFTDTGATFSPCRTWRYLLWRTWDQAQAPLVFLMLNPSTATEDTDDPTVARCGTRARRLGYGGVVVTNLFAFRSTDPRQLKRCEDPIGPDNDAAIRAAVQHRDVVLAWGCHGALLDRAAHVLAMLRAEPCRLLALRVTSDGHPSHPLYLPYDLRPEPFRP